MGRFTDIQNDVIKRYRVNLDPFSKCWGRTHAHIKGRRVCKWHPKNSVESTFTLLHEVGHIETNHSGMRRAEEEFAATVWAVERAEEYGLTIPDRIIDEYQEYIDRERDRGIRRGGAGYGQMKLRRQA